MKYVLIALAALPMIALAGAEYAVEITCLVLMVAAAIRLIDVVDGNVGDGGESVGGDLSDGAA